MAPDEVLEDNRKSVRKRVAIPCAVNRGGTVFPGRLLDLSDGGAFVQTDQTIGCGTVLSIVFKAQVGGRAVFLGLKAKVVYVGRYLQGFENFYGFGAQFEPLPDKMAARLAAVLESLQSEPQRKYEFL
jgi:hypothetical protein